MDEATLWRTLLNHGVIEKVGNSEESCTFQVTIGTDWTHNTLAEAVLSKAIKVQYGEVAPSYQPFCGGARERILRTIGEQLGIPVYEVTTDKQIVADYGADSLDTIELIMALEDEFGVEIPDEVAESVVTVGDIVEHPWWATVGVIV